MPDVSIKRGSDRMVYVLGRNPDRSIRRVQSLKIYYDDGRDEGDGPGIEPHLCFELHNEAGIEKRHHFHIQDCEIIQAVFHREGV